VPGFKRTSNYLGISIIQRTSCLKQQVRESPCTPRAKELMPAMD